MNLDVPSILVGGLISLILALLVAPLLEPIATDFLTRILGRWGPRGRESLSGPWNFVWTLEGEPPDRGNEVRIELQEIAGIAVGNFVWHGRSYRLRAKREGSVLTGTYVDERGGGTYSGAFQLVVDPRIEHMIGRWVGFNRRNEVVGGGWVWRRPNHRYPFQRHDPRQEAVKPGADASLGPETLQGARTPSTSSPLELTAAW